MFSIFFHPRIICDQFTSTVIRALWLLKMAFRSGLNLCHGKCHALRDMGEKKVITTIASLFHCKVASDFTRKLQGLEVVAERFYKAKGKGRKNRPWILGIISFNIFPDIPIDQPQDPDFILPGCA